MEAISVVEGCPLAAPALKRRHGVTASSGPLQSGQHRRTSAQLPANRYRSSIGLGGNLCRRSDQHLNSFSCGARKSASQGGGLGAQFENPCQGTSSIGRALRIWQAVEPTSGLSNGFLGMRLLPHPSSSRPRMPPRSFHRPTTSLWNPLDISHAEIGPLVGALQSGTQFSVHALGAAANLLGGVWGSEGWEVGIATAVGVSAGALATWALANSRPEAQTHLYQGELISATDNDFNRFVLARSPQTSSRTIKNLFDVTSNGPYVSSGFKYRRHCLRLGDGGHAALDWPAHLAMSGSDGRDSVVLIVPGTVASSSDEGVRMLVQRAADLGHFPVVVNQRGFAKSPVTTSKLFDDGCTEDLAQAVDFFQSQRSAWGAVAAIGIGMGANLLVKYLGERGSEALPIAAAVAVGCPFDLAASADNVTRPGNEERSAALATERVDLLRQHLPLFEGKTEGVEAALSATSLADFDDAFTWRANGYASREGYYGAASCGGHVEHVNTPLLFVQSASDALAPAAAIPRAAIHKNPCTTLLLTRGRHDVSTTPVDSWTADVALEWLAAVELALLKGKDPRASRIERKRVGALREGFQDGDASKEGSGSNGLASGNGRSRKTGAPREEGEEAVGGLVLKQDPENRVEGKKFGGSAKEGEGNGGVSLEQASGSERQEVASEVSNRRGTAGDSVASGNVPENEGTGETGSGGLEPGGGTRDVWMAGSEAVPERAERGLEGADGSTESEEVPGSKTTENGSGVSGGEGEGAYVGLVGTEHVPESAITKRGLEVSGGGRGKAGKVSQAGRGQEDKASGVLENEGLHEDAKDGKVLEGSREDKEGHESGKVNQEVRAVTADHESPAGDHGAEKSEEKGLQGKVVSSGVAAGPTNKGKEHNPGAYSRSGNSREDKERGVPVLEASETESRTGKKGRRQEKQGAAGEVVAEEKLDRSALLAGTDSERDTEGGGKKGREVGSRTDSKGNRTAEEGLKRAETEKSSQAISERKGGERNGDDLEKGAVSQSGTRAEKDGEAKTDSKAKKEAKEGTADAEGPEQSTDANAKTAPKEGETETDSKDRSPPKEEGEEEAPPPVDAKGIATATAESFLNVADVALPGTLSEEKKKQVVAAVNNGESLASALDLAVPPDVRMKVTGAVTTYIEKSKGQASELTKQIDMDRVSGLLSTGGGGLMSKIAGGLKGNLGRPPPKAAAPPPKAPPKGGEAKPQPTAKAEEGTASKPSNPPPSAPLPSDAPPKEAPTTDASKAGDRAPPKSAPSETASKRGGENGPTPPPETPKSEAPPPPESAPSATPPEPTPSKGGENSAPPEAPKSESAPPPQTAASKAEQAPPQPKPAEPSSEKATPPPQDAAAPRGDAANGDPSAKAPPPQNADAAPKEDVGNADTKEKAPAPQNEIPKNEEAPKAAEPASDKAAPPQQSADASLPADTQNQGGGTAESSGEAPPPPPPQEAPKDAAPPPKTDEPAPPNPTPTEAASQAAAAVAPAMDAAANAAPPGAPPAGAPPAPPPAVSLPPPPTNLNVSSALTTLDQGFDDGTQRAVHNVFGVLEGVIDTLEAAEGGKEAESTEKEAESKEKKAESVTAKVTKEDGKETETVMATRTETEGAKQTKELSSTGNGGTAESNGRTERNGTLEGGAGQQTATVVAEQTRTDLGGGQTAVENEVRAEASRSTQPSNNGAGSENGSVGVTVSSSSSQTVSEGQNGRRKGAGGGRVETTGHEDEHAHQATNGKLKGSDSGGENLRDDIGEERRSIEENRQKLQRQYDGDGSQNGAVQESGQPSRNGTAVPSNAAEPKEAAAAENEQGSKGGVLQAVKGTPPVAAVTSVVSNVGSTAAAVANGLPEHRKLQIMEVVLTSLKLEIGRRVGTSGFEALTRVNWEAEAGRVAEAVAEVVAGGGAMVGLTEPPGPNGRADAPGAQSPGGKTGGSQGGGLDIGSIMKAVGSVVGTGGMFGGVLPMGVLVGIVVAAVGTLYHMMQDDRKKKKEEEKKAEGEAKLEAAQQELESLPVETEDDHALGLATKWDEEPEGETGVAETELDQVEEIAPAPPSKGLSSEQTASIIGAGGVVAAGIAAVASSATGVTAADIPQQINAPPNEQERPQGGGGLSNTVGHLATQAVAVVKSQIPRDPSGDIDQERLVLLLADAGGRGGMFRIAGKLALFWGGVRGATRVTERLLGFLKIDRKNLPKRLLGFTAMALILWTPVLVPLLPTILQHRATGGKGGVAEAAAAAGLYLAVLMLIHIWGRVVRGFKRPFTSYGLRILNRKSAGQLVTGQLAGAFLVAAFYVLQWRLGHVTWVGGATQKPAANVAAGVLRQFGKVHLVLHALAMGVAVSLVEELIFRSWIHEEAAVDLGPHGAALLSAALFSTAHWSRLAAPGLFLLGLALIGARARAQGNLALPMGLHSGLIAANYVVQVGQLTAVNPASPVWLTGGGNPLMSALGLGLTAVMAVGLYPWGKGIMKPKDAEEVPDKGVTDEEARRQIDEHGEKEESELKARIDELGGQEQGQIEGGETVKSENGVQGKQ